MRSPSSNAIIIIGEWERLFSKDGAEKNVCILERSLFRTNSKNITKSNSREHIFKILRRNNV